MESSFLQARGLLRYIGLFLSGVCHQLPDHSLRWAGVQLPLCCRCTGTYLGGLLVLLNLGWRGRLRAGRLPPLRVLLAVGALFAAWAVDGLNSYVQFLVGRPWLYAPLNSVRLLTGLGNGISLSLLVVPLFNLTFWSEPDSVRSASSLKELSGLLLQAVAITLVLLLRLDVLLYPALAAEAVSVLLMLSIVNAVIVIMLSRRMNRATSWTEALAPLTWGLAFALLEVGGLAWVRSWLGPRVPFPPF